MSGWGSELRMIIYRGSKGDWILGIFVQMAIIQWIDEVTKCKYEYVRGDVILVKEVNRNFYSYTKLFNSLLDVNFEFSSHQRYLIISLKLSIHACVWKWRYVEKR